MSWVRLPSAWKGSRINWRRVGNRQSQKQDYNFIVIIWLGTEEIMNALYKCCLIWSHGWTLFKVAVVRIALIATFALRPNWSQAIHDDPYKLYISEQVCVWSMCWHQRSPPFSNIWGCYSHQHGRGIKIKNWISCVFTFFFIKNIKSLVTWL